MNLTYQHKRILYYLGIGLLVADQLPVLKEYTKIINFEITTGITFLSIIAILVGVGAIMAFDKKFG